MSENNFDILVIGGGPAGFTAGIYASRANHSTLVLEGAEPGGQLMTTTEIENFPGFSKGIDASTLMSEMREQATRFGTIVKQEVVLNINFDSYPYVVKTDSQEYIAKAIILATGATARYLGLPSEHRLKGKGVSACATCDGFFFNGKVVAVIGGGDSAMEEANFLTKFATKLYLINRSEKFRASPIMFDRIKNNPKVEIIANKQVAEVIGEDKVTALKLKDSTTGELSELPVDGMFLAIGHNPNTSLVKDLLEIDKRGYLKSIPGSSKTSVKGLFVAGDVADPIYKQAITAAGSGCKAALDAQKFLEPKEGGQ